MSMNQNGYTPKVNGYNWRQRLTDLIQSERREIEMILELMRVAETPATSLILGQLLAAKTERIETLYQLLNMREDR